MYHIIVFEMKEQTAMEYLWAYVWTFILLIIITAAIAINALSRGSLTLPSNLGCFISPSLNCEDLFVMLNSTSGKGVVVFTNGLGATMHFPTNTFGILPYELVTNGIYNGGCVPANVPTGSTVICNATIKNFKAKLGQQLYPRFIFSYELCQNKVCNTQVYNTTGTGTADVAQFSGAFTKIK